MPTHSAQEMLKHVVRRDIWLPACRRRLDAVKQQHGPDAFIRYFTFSSGDALDPIFLYIADVLQDRVETTPNWSNGLTTVHFFNRNPKNPQPGMTDLPGARSFGGPFIETVLFV